MHLVSLVCFTLLISPTLSVTVQKIKILESKLCTDDCAVVIHCSFDCFHVCLCMN